MPSTPETYVPQTSLYDNIAERGYSDLAHPQPINGAAGSGLAALTGSGSYANADPTSSSSSGLITHALDSDSANPFEPRKSTVANLTPKAVGRAVAARVARAARRGNLPFLIVFLVSLFIFFGALAGVGYVDPDAQAALQSGDSEFVVGGPVFDPAENEKSHERQMAEQAELEKQWAKKKRPNAGAWMQKQRDDRAVRVKSSDDKSKRDIVEAAERNVI